MTETPQNGHRKWQTQELNTEFLPLVPLNNKRTNHHKLKEATFDIYASTFMQIVFYLFRISAFFFF